MDPLWVDKCKENSFLEKDCIHGTNCKRINNCSCYNKPESTKRRKGKRKGKKEVAGY